MALRRRDFLELGAATAVAALGGCAPPPQARTARAPGRGRSPLAGKVEHLVVLMLENRSYDQMLGSLVGPEHDGTPLDVALPYVAHGERATRWVKVREGAPPDSLSPDPGHNFQAVDAQIHGDGLDRAADMRGFARRYALDNPTLTREAMESYATLYGDGRLPILQTLAKEYGVCSHWFCSLPSSTAPNRMFAHAGTSTGVTRKGAYYRRLAGKLIFDALDARDPRSFRVYFHDMPHLWLTGDAWMKSFSGHFSYMPGFARDVRADQLPTYSFIEPQHVVPPWSSQHPIGGVSHGEALIARIYNTLAASPAVFEKTLLVIVYDEHGGFYDHVIPPGHPGWEAQCPGVRHEVVRPDGARAVGQGREDGYDFSTLGPRVPAVVVSPWIDRGSVFGWKAQAPERRATFDHTSILATVGHMTGVWVDSLRARAATPLEVTLNRKTPRHDYPARLVFDERAYRDVKPGGDEICGDSPMAGVGQELYETWRAERGEGTPAEMLEHVRTIVEG